jgi:hypothetical protein
MKQYTAASCFVTYLLPHVLFVPDFGERKRVVQACCLAWNISLSDDAAQREQHLDMVWKMVEADNRKAPPPGLKEGFRQDLRNLIDQKRDLFPWLMTTIPRADLVQKNGRDALAIEAGGRTEEIELVIYPDARGLPAIIEALRQMQRDTAEQVKLVRQARRTPGALTKDMTAHMGIAYCVQRADLGGYQRMLTVWREAHPEPAVTRVIGHWLDVLAEIEANSKAVLAVLQDAGTVA